MLSKKVKVYYTLISYAVNFNAKKKKKKKKPFS